MNFVPEPLREGDTVAIVAPAKAIEVASVENARTFFENAGFQVKLSKNCLGQYNYFSGTIGDRLTDFQDALDDPQVKAIVCARGGYGCIQLVDRIKWGLQLHEPKWIVGFSDVTVFHQHLQKNGVQSIHGTMPLNFSSNTNEALDTLLTALKGHSYSITAPKAKNNKTGSAQGRLLGGNLSILYSLIGTDEQPDYSDSILFVEDLAEPLYAIDRIFHAMSKAGILDQIKGLVVGGMTDLKDTETPFGLSYEEIILDHFMYRQIPVAFNFPAGHIDDNRALVLGASVRLSVTESESRLEFPG